MHNFTYENRGSSRFLIYQIQENDEVDEMALGMLGQNKIAGILPVSYTQMDSERYFRYSGLSTGTLKNLMGGIVTKNRILTVLENICIIIRASEEYLLEGSAFVLDKEYIYVDGATGKTELIYLPLLNQSSSISYAVFFKEIVTSIISDPSEDGTYVTRILYYLNSTENFSLTDFLRLIKELNLGGSAADERKFQKQRDSALSGSESRRSALSNFESGKSMPGSERRMPEQKLEAKPVPVLPKMEQSRGKQTVRKTQEKSEPSSVQKKEEDNGDVYSFEFPGGGKVVQQPSKPSKPVASEEQVGEDSGKMSAWYLLRNFNSENLEKFKNQGKGETPKKSEKKSGEKKEKPEKKGKKKGFGKQGILTLVSMNPEYPKTITVDREDYRIGRKKTNDAVLSGLPEVSREHCKIVREKDGYYLIDLRSTYGTVVDGVHCKPDEKSPALSEGSVIDLPGIKFRVEFH